jgi:hypothetical protein
MFYEANNKKDFVFGWIIGAMTIVSIVVLFKVLS